MPAQTSPFADRYVERRWTSPDGLNLYARDYAPAAGEAEFSPTSSSAPSISRWGRGFRCRRSCCL